MRSKTRSVLWVAVVALTLAITSSARADDSTESVMTGTVTSVNPSAASFTMKTSTGPMTYYTNENSRFTSAGQPIELANLEVGDRVAIHSSKLMENAVVSRVDVLSSGHLTAQNRRHDTLPKTGSPLPLLGIFGVILLGAALLSRVGLRWLD